MKTKTLGYIAVIIIVGSLTYFFVKFISPNYHESKNYIWSIESSPKSKDILVRGKKIDRIKNDINKLIYALNESKKDPETFATPPGEEPLGSPKLKLRDIKEKVVNVEIVNAEYLTQRMGTTGAEHFLAVATFTLTEHDDIKFVNFIFREGDHAAPGLYSRKRFLENLDVAK